MGGGVEEGLDRVLTALSDPTRRAILTALASGPQRVTELARPFALSLNSVSKHLRVLESAGMVTRQRRGREHIISLDPRPMSDVQAWLEQQQQLWSQRMHAMDAYLTRKSIESAEDPEKGQSDDSSN
jgi:DNA-binding transcriptional ArsR family regulator